MKNIFEKEVFLADAPEYRAPKHGMRKQIARKYEARGGYAMLFAVLVSSVLLSIGLSIFNLTIKELVLSSSGRESQFSFYSADTGAECALYWDFKSSYPSVMFATSSGSQEGDWRRSFIMDDSPDCVGNPLLDSFLNPTETSPPSSPHAVTQFTLNIPAVDPQYCAIVTVTKSSDMPIEDGGIITTVIDSRGYNTPCADTTNPNRVERALKVTY